MDSILDSNDQREIGYDEEKLHADILTQHNMECRYYEYFSQPSNPLPQPKIYFIQEMSNSHQGIIFMEDLSKNTKTIDIFTPLTNGQIKNMLQHIMNFYSFILQQTEMPWQSKFPKSALEEFEMNRAQCCLICIGRSKCTEITILPST
uniref:Uncharacterized protein n=1 Tax=Acrobeloides nanus TaxID=290746 RepID=A0A914DQ39_9BILA